MYVKSSLGKLKIDSIKKTDVIQIISFINFQFQN